MLIIDRKFIERYCWEYDRRSRGTQDQINEDAILKWVSKQGPPRLLNKEYFIKLGRWKTPRYEKTREINEKCAIIKATRSAYLTKDDLEKMRILKKLKGVGVAVASTILYYLHPEKYAIFDYHVRNTLKKAGKLDKGKEDDSDRLWLEYTRIIRRLSSFHNKTPREVEKALFAYDKWGCVVTGDDGNEEKTQMEQNEKLEIYLPKDKAKQLNDVAQREYGEDGANVAKFWIIERLLQFGAEKHKQVPNENVGGPTAVEIVNAKVSLPQKGQSWEISRMGKSKTERLFAKGGPLDLLTVETKFGAIWHERKEGSRILWIPIKFSVNSKVYDAYWHYREKKGGSWIGSELNDGGVKLTDPLSAVGFKPGDEIRLTVRDNNVQVDK